MGEAGLWSRPPYSFGFSMIRVYVIFSHPGHYLPVTPPNHRPGQKPQLLAGQNLALFPQLGTLCWEGPQFGDDTKELN